MSRRSETELGGWDHHSGVLAYQGQMLPQVSAAIGAFYNQLVAMRMENNVTLYTASDFGRTLTSNCQGSDHAWDGNQIVVGSSVISKRSTANSPASPSIPMSAPSSIRSIPARAV